MRRYYIKEFPEFAAAVAENPEFRPRFHLFYTQREAEQDAYFWFLRGQRLALQESLTRIGVSPERQNAAVAQIMAQNAQKVSEAVSGAENGSERQETQRTANSTTSHHHAAGEE